MADETPSLHIDTDWKKQAQEEKRRLAEQEKQKAATPVVAAPSSAAAPSPSGSATGASSGQAAGRGAGERGAAREIPPASFATLVQSFMTQALYYLGDLAPRGSEPTISLDMAKHQIDLLAILDERTQNNLSPEERQMLDAVLYEVRMRYVAVASQYIS